MQIAVLFAMREMSSGSARRLCHQSACMYVCVVAQPDYADPCAAALDICDCHISFHLPVQKRRIVALQNGACCDSSAVWGNVARQQRSAIARHCSNDLLEFSCVPYC